MPEKKETAGREVRSMPVREARSVGEHELRFNEDSNEIVGRIPFNQEAVIGGMFREVIRPTFFDRAMSDGDDVVAWAEHGSGYLPFARSTVKEGSGSLRFIKHKDYLEWRAEPISASDVDDLRARIPKIINATSFAFIVDDHNPDEVKIDRSEKDKLPLRELLSAKAMFDVAPVTFAAYDNTSVGLRAGEYRSAEDIYNEHIQSTDAQECAGDDDVSEPTEQELGDIARRQKMLRIKHNIGA